MNNFYIIKNTFLYKLTNSGTPRLCEKADNFKLPPTESYLHKWG